MPAYYFRRSFCSDEIIKVKITIADWDELNRNVHSNAIDRYLENKKLSVLTTCPFLVGHKEDLSSTIWGQQNTIYTQLIADSSKKLEEMTNAYKKENNL